ncbi:ABC transporter substrate-binding protein [Nocardioides sp. CER19]|uniref:ABC transporter substrate-binding protein n=1 Tax=Nocardioides sp. CER19 TaxID=3038538 RepID=UPI00244C08B2|nr:ABC transporter substrate-binding protein [Nocardioides sp. CER19]MDH2412703.1 ABC transporter substrate-binding protein [Nocardioides sp. CER19]
MRLRRTALIAPLLLLAAAGCAPADSDGKAASEPTTTATSSSGTADACATDSLPTKTAGKLTVGTDSPAYEPWFSDNDPSNGKGFESAVAYAVADKLGFAKDAVSWVKVPFNNSYAPGAKAFDFDINQISITPDREKVVDFSQPYYTATQAVVTLKKNAGKASSLADLKKLKLGAQTGTTSLTAVRQIVKPDKEPLVFNDSNTPKQALLNGQVDAVVFDLPTAFYITAAEIEGSTITGQFSGEGVEGDRFGLLFEKGNKLRDCVDQAIDELTSDGTLAALEKQWLSDVVDVPVLQ